MTAAKRRFFLFSETLGDLERRINTMLAAKNNPLGLGSYLELIAHFKVEDQGGSIPWTQGTENPFRVQLGDRLIAIGEEEAPSGYGILLEGSAADVDVLTEAIRTVDISGDPLVRSTIGGEVGTGQPFFDAPNWQNWTTGTGRGNAFGTRRQARRLIGADALGDLDGEDVRVVIVDRGFSRRYIEDTLGGEWGAGFIWDTSDGTQVGGSVDIPYVSTPREHGSMVARTIHDLAPATEFWDMPLLPRQITRVTPFALSATFAMITIDVVRKLLGNQHRWVVVNAWGFDDRFGEDTWNDYATSPYHPLNVWTRLLAESADVVFAAGNSGQFRPDPEAGPYDRGPGRSIWGANAGGNVTSVGAVRGDGHWVGTASQGPGPASLSVIEGDLNEKPDLCAPSWFVEDDDTALRSGGTSAACAMTAGVIAAIRTHWPQDNVSPAELRTILRDAARREWHTGWNGRMGKGILNVPIALAALP